MKYKGLVVLTSKTNGNEIHEFVAANLSESFGKARMILDNNSTKSLAGITLVPGSTRNDNTRKN